jgi:hypothetical protein
VSIKEFVLGVAMAIGSHGAPVIAGPVMPTAPTRLASIQIAAYSTYPTRVKVVEVFAINGFG